MARTIIVDAEEKVACPKCSRRFFLSEGLSRQAIERHAGEFERSLAEHRQHLDPQLAAAATAPFATPPEPNNGSSNATDSSPARFRPEEPAPRKQLSDSP